MEIHTEIKQFITEDLLFLTDEKKIYYDGKNIKTDRIINFVNDMIIRTFTQQSDELKLWSTILQKKHGHDYKKIINFLIENKFMELKTSYCAGKKSNTYKINIGNKKIRRCVINDKVVIKSIKKDEDIENVIKYTKSPIEPTVRDKMSSFLNDVTVEYSEALEFLYNEYEEGLLTDNKFYINLDSLDRIHDKRVFLKFDEYGRMHTNYTTLKKEIRNKFIKIDGEPVCDIDITNSQPLFFSLFLKEELGYENFNDECKVFYDLCIEGLIYDYILDKCEEFTKRKEIKIMMYIVLFGNNSSRKEENKIFKKLFPTVFEYIKEFKAMRGSYKELSHKLQSMESSFIYNTLIKKILDKYPYIKMITVHDSIMFSRKYKNEVELIFNNEMKKLIRA